MRLLANLAGLVLTFGVALSTALVLMRGLSGPVEVTVPGIWQAELARWAKGLDVNPYAPPRTEC